MSRLGLALIVLAATAGWVPSAGAGVLPPLPLPLPLPTTPVPVSPPGPGSSTPGNHGAPPPPPPPRPSRSPPSRCADQSVPGVIPFVTAVFPCDFPDPMVLHSGGTWYAYASATGWEDAGHDFPVLRSSDLRHWRFVGDALTHAPGWSSGDLWGPSVLRWRGRYLLFYNARLEGTAMHCLAVATAAAPQGPFATRRRLGCRSGRERGYIDPAPLVAPRRRLYLFFSIDGPRHALAALRLSPNGLRATGRPRTVLDFSRRWGALRSRTVEGPWPLHRGAFYYLFYSTGSWSADYRMAYAVARSPLGPYADSAPVPLLSATVQLPAPGGGSVVNGPAGANWLAFAAWSGAPGYTLGSERTMRVAPLRWTRNGVPQVVLSGSSSLGRGSVPEGNHPLQAATSVP